MSHQALTPKLTKLDRRVLDLLPTWRASDPSPPPWALVSAHQAAEALGTDDVRSAREILQGLEHLAFAASATSRSRKVRVWFRTSWTREP